MATPKTGKAYLFIPIVLILGAGLLYTGCAFRVRDTIPANADVCHSSTGRCTSTSATISPASSSSSLSSWSTMTSLRSKRGFEMASTRGSFAKSKQRPPDEAYKEENYHTLKKNYKTSTSRSWSKSSKIQASNEENNIHSNENNFSNSNEVKKKIDNDDEIIQIEVEDEQVLIENEDSQKNLRERLSRPKKDVEKREREQKVIFTDQEESKRKTEKEKELSKEEKEIRENKIEEKIQNEKENDFFEERRQKEEEERQRQEKELKLQKERDEEERQKKENEERRLKEEVERKLKEEEERRLKEETERRLKEEEERRMKEEFERRVREEKERRLKEEAEKRRKEEEDRQRKEEIENRRKEEEERRLIEKKKQLMRMEEEQRLRKEEERLLKEEEERQLKEKEKRQMKVEEELRKKEEEKKQLRLETEKRELKKIIEEKEKLLEKARKEEKKIRKEEEKRKMIKSNSNADEVRYEIEDNDEINERSRYKSQKKREKVIITNKEKEKSLGTPVSKPYVATKVIDSDHKKLKENLKISNIDTTIDDDTSQFSTIKRTINDETKATEPRPKKGPEGFLSLVELNDMILSVPTFVPNFTAVENSDCQKHGKIFLRQLRGYKLWALQMLDSSAKIPAGLLRGNVNQLGDFDQCLGVMARVKIDEKTVKIQGKYCLANIDVYATHLAVKLPVNFMQSRALIRGNMRDPGYFIPKFTTINWGICLPDTCTAEDARRSVEDALKLYNMTTGLRFMVDINSKMCYVKEKSQSYSKETIGVLYFYAIFICLVIVATIRDYFSMTQEKGNYSERIIMAFSLKRTMKVLFGNTEIDSSNISCIHGIRSLSTMALYISHKMIPISRMPYANRISLTEVASNPLTLILRAPLIYTDSLLLLSGVVTAYNMARELNDRDEIRWFCRFIARFIRLTPSLLAVIFWYAFIMEHTGSGPQWNAVVKENADICKENAWINLLYVQNFFPFEEMCATQTYQLALNMQLSLIAPVIVFFLQVKPIVGVIIVFFVLQVSATLRYLATTNNNLSLVIFHGMSVKQIYKSANLTYLLPLHRVTPYLFGVCLGVILHHTGKNIRIHKVFNSIGWLIALALGSWSLFSPWRLAHRDYVYNVEEATQYAVLSPIFTAVALSWTIFACFTENGGIVNKVLSNYWMMVFSRLSYTIYLSQFIIFFYNIGTARYSSEFQLYRIIDFYEVLSIASVSIVLTLLFDIPMQEVRNIILESTDSLSIESEKLKEYVTPEEIQSDVKKISKNMNLEDEEECTPGGWNWNRGTFTKIAKSEPRDYEPNEENESFRNSNINRQNIRRHTMIRSRAYDEWDRDVIDRRISRSEDHSLDNVRMNRDDYKMNNSRFDDELFTENHLYPRDRYYSSNYTRSPLRDASTFHRSSSRERSKSKEVEILARDYNNKPIITISKEEDYKNSRPSRPSTSRFFDQQFSLSESEIDVVGSRRNTNNFNRRSSAELRISDEEDWENDLRFRRNRYQQERVHSQESERVPPPVVEEDAHDEWDSLKRRSSAEGKMALLKEPLRPGNMELWTVSKMQFGSSQESDDELDDDMYLQQRREYREQGPPLREEFEEDESNDEMELRKSIALERRAMSFDEGDDITNSFVLNKNSKRITVQDLSMISSDDEIPKDSSWNNLDVKSSSSGLFKRESIVRSQASEEDPEYLIPERPKLVEQEQEHPFKKAWQMQKSRSEEEGSSGFVIKDYKTSNASFEKQNKEIEYKNEVVKSNDLEESNEDSVIDVTYDIITPRQTSNNEIDCVESSFNFVLPESYEPTKEEFQNQENIKEYIKTTEENSIYIDRDT